MDVHPTKHGIDRYWPNPMYVNSCFWPKKNYYSQNGVFFLHKQLHQNGVATFDPALCVDDPSELGIATGT